MIQEDKITTCDICGKQIWFFSEGLIFYINGEPRLLCKNCQKKHESKISFRRSHENAFWKI